ncbi:MAG TPA: hypothetical protein VIC08_04770 [Cellvibrionaceae bacterium]
MDHQLPARDFCLQHLTPEALTDTLAEDTRPQRRIEKILWLTLAASVLLHAALLAGWANWQTKMETITPAPSLQITLNAAPIEPAAQPAATEQIEEPAVEDIEDTPAEVSPVDPEIATPPEIQTAPATPDKPAITIATEAITTSTPATSEPTSGTVFHPGLRSQIHSARSTRERLHNNRTPILNSWQDTAGSTWIDMGNGTCMRSAGNSQGTTQSWELPTRCKGQLTEGENILHNVQKTLNRP